MEKSTYWIILLIANGIILYFGLHLIFGAISRELKKSKYHVARICAGSGFCISPISGFLFYIFDFELSNEPFYATAVNLTTYYTIAILFAIAFIYIIDTKSEQIRKTVIAIALSFIVFLIPTWLPIAIGEKDIINSLHIVANLMLAIFIICIGINVYLAYKKTLKKIDNYYSDDAVTHLKWIRNCFHLFIGLGIIACISPFSNYYPTILGVFYIVYQIFTYLYMYESFLRFEFKSILVVNKEERINIKEIHKDTDVQITKPTTISSQTILHIEKELSNWIKKGGYCTNGITVKSVASEIFTNRTYLSNYINSTYKCTFKEWITEIRIDEAKKLLYDCEEFTTDEIAKKVGFASTSSFINTFRSLEGVTPLKWRERNKRFKQKSIDSIKR